MKKKLIKTLVDKAEANPLADVWIWDTEVEGFGLRIRPTGRKTFVIRYRTTAGAQRKQMIARASDMAPEKARELARKEFAKVAEGQDPIADRVVAAKETDRTVEKMFKGYVAHMRDKGRVSATEVERVLLLAEANAADKLGRDKPANEVTPMQVVDYLSIFYRAGHRGAADKHRSYIASAYTWAMKSANDYTSAHRQDWGITRNPASEVPKDSGAIGTRDRNLAAAELRMLWVDTEQGAEGFTLETGGCVRMLIGCGQRVQETLRIEGCEIDLVAKLWRMPAHKTKGRKLPHTIPLPDQVLPVLRKLISVHGAGPLFPARTGSTSELIAHQSIMQALERWAERVGVAAFQSRDLRRTWKSRGHDAGIDRFTRDLIQQHAKNDTGSKAYDRAEYLPQMREAMAKWSTWLAENVEAKPPMLLAA